MSVLKKQKKNQTVLLLHQRFGWFPSCD
jgi:hypothetical protein